ncbi:MAG TPA: TonB-dependent receptor [Vicinamibacterales bacterium]|nr:TonB-dependent receptor [Vicinamibacterales bacterium]
MRFKVVVLALVALFATSAIASAQSQTGEIFGKVTDGSGAVLPGVTVTVTGPVLLQPLTAVTSETGTFNFPRIEIGTYSVKFELAGFKTVVNQGIIVTVGFAAAVNAQLGISTVQETITVTGESPIVDTKAVGTKQTFTNELLQSIPSARDPWVILQQTAGIAMDRENVGGNMSGQQSNYVSRGGNPTNNKWSLDGVDITDMSATGASPSYYDFDAFEEMTITTGGVDVTQQTGGVGINLVTKSGSDKFKGSSRFYVTDQKFESNNIDATLRGQGASSGNPIQNIKDYGVEAGGPIKKGRAWVWGSFGKQLVDVGVLGFYQPTAACAAVKAAPTTFSVDDVNACLNTDETLLQTTNLKAEVQLFKGNKITLFNNFAKKERNARGADDLHPIETTTPQGAVDASFGKHWWNTGPNPTYKFGDQWVISDRLLVDVTYAHVGNNFVLGFHAPELSDVEPSIIVSTGLNGRSATASTFIRPVNSLNFNANYFLPSTLGSDHALKIGGYWRDSNTTSITHTGGFATVRFPNSLSNDCSLAATGCQADLARDGYSVYDLLNYSAYVQDTVTHGRFTMQLGVRYDYNKDSAQAANIAANPLSTTWLPAIAFAGADPGVAFNNFSPRVGMTYDISANGKTLVHGNYARYYGQVGNGGVAGTINPVAQTTLRYPWVDANRDGIAQVGEVQASANPIAIVAGTWASANPGNAVSSNSVDPNLRNDSTDEVILGIDREIGAGFAVGANYVWRRYGDFSWNDRPGISSADFAPVTFTPAAAACPAGATCPAITFYQPLFQNPTTLFETNIPGYTRNYNGVEVTGRKRMSNHWLMNTSFAYNSTIVNFGSFPGSQPSIASATISEDPTNRSLRDGYQYDYLTGGSGIGNVYVNAKYLFKLSGMYQAPLGINVSAFYNARQGYPQEISVQTPSRVNGVAQVDVLLNPVGDTRLPNYQNVDFHVDRAVKVGTVRFVPSLDVFNVGNFNTIQAIRSRQNAANANQIQAILAPRVVRFGIKFNW